MTHVVELLRELVAIDSVSERSNLPIAAALERRLTALGLAVTRHPYLDPAGVEKVNLVALAGPSTAPPGAGGLCFVGHTDTVPYDSAWSGALAVEERDGKLFGRGTADTKGFLAAVLVAVEQVGISGLARPLAVLCTADEEIGCAGARRLVDELALRPAHAIVGEPTGLVPVRAHKGYWLAEVEVRGAEGHSAHPDVGRNAIFDAARVLARVEAVAADLREDRDDAYAPPFTTLNVGTIAGGKARNVIPGSCRFPVEWRPLPRQDGEEVPRRIRAEIVRFLEEETGRRATTVPFGTELPYVTALGARGCVCGPGDIREAHRTGEFVPVEELHRAVALYTRAIERFCR